MCRKFQLDDFQRLGITCIDNQHNVLIAAHTSAGKVCLPIFLYLLLAYPRLLFAVVLQTVLAEYAIAVALRDKQRVIYTAPIKALSNQKFRELKECFDDVGLMTGDVNVRL